MSLIASALAAQVGRHRAKQATWAALKRLAQRAVGLVPVAGPVVGGAISGAVAVGSTLALGKAWVKVCEYVTAHDMSKFDDFLESKEGKVLLLFLGACGLAGLIATFATTPAHKAIPASSEALPAPTPTPVPIMLDPAHLAALEKRAQRLAMHKTCEFVRADRRQPRRRARTALHEALQTTTDEVAKAYFEQVLEEIRARLLDLDGGPRGWPSGG
ncbi:hypothetical protein AB0M43_07610 [Longispora sp. NPDC051575]|uniref:hypothetical protein n=1 Tax=Longispora sp. NPDC051575 TaxID=3154943 RepID=UPI003423A4B1